jgi:uncharacterized membrane protein YgdD (TMEM256/DUF423 family)
LATFETGVRYQMYHVCFIVYRFIWWIDWCGKKTIYYLVLSGVILFSVRFIYWLQMTLHLILNASDL